MLKLKTDQNTACFGNVAHSSARRNTKSKRNVIVSDPSDPFSIIRTPTKEISDDMDKSWDHPWSTDEMRKKRREWSLAGDAGLLKHLHQFSENLRSKTNKTQEALDVLTTRLTKTAILVDNVTNTSLALANTQFIESRVQDDDVEMEKKTEKSANETKDQDEATADLIASVSDSVRKGLDIMDEKYRRMEVVDSDSDGEDDDIVLSVILGPNNPYQDRPLPYVIGSDKWKSSTKVGLESSSSESDQVDEDDEESESDKDNRVFDMNVMPKVNLERLSSSSSESETYNHRNNISHIKSDKLDTVSQNIDSSSDSPIDNGSKGSLVNTVAPSFAEELAKRLGSVRQVEKSVRVDEQNDESINRLKDDMFAAEEENNSFSNKTDNIFTADKQIFNDGASPNSWKVKPIKTYKSNIIPASVDVPPPISTVSTNPKSAIDDLFGDADSEDPDDIFSSKNTTRNISKNSEPKNRATAEDPKNKQLNLAAPASNIATSTPEMNVNSSQLFSDEEDVADLFSTATVRRGTSMDVPTPSKKKLAGSISILGNVLASDIQSKALNRMPRAHSSGSSSSDVAPNDESTKESDSAAASSRNLNLSDNIDDRSPIVQPRHNVESLATTNESSYSSGISIQPPSINNTGGSSIGADFQPQMTSTRLKSEEIYRERVASDSLFAARSRNPVDNSNNSNATSNPAHEEQLEDTSSTQQDDVFENEDLFGPPPLPKLDSKQTKSKVPSLFDDSDSGDELFSTPSSGSRSQKSTDFFVTTPQYSEKSKPAHRRGLFDEEINIFGSKDSPDVDIFGITSKLPNTKESNNSSTRSVPASSSDLFKTVSREASVPKDTRVAKLQSAVKEMSLFDDDDDDDDSDLFSSKLIKSDIKSESHIFKDDEDNDLFSSKESTAGKEQFSVDNKNSQAVKDHLTDNMLSVEAKKKTSNVLSDKGLFSTDIRSSNLIFDDEDYDSLFGRRTAGETNKTKEETSTVEEVTSRKIDSFQTKDKDEFKESQRTAFVSNTVDVTQGTDDLTENVLAANVEHAEIKEDQTRINKVIDSVKDNETESRKTPPKTLDIQGDISSSLPDEDSKGQRRTVSGKIKNLMGKMGDLKILSPMDTPPLWRRSEEKTDEEDSTADRDSDDGGCMSLPGQSTPSSISEGGAVRKESLPSTASGGSNIETAISFDEPAQVETLSTEASKTRARIQAKRRPQSRHARKSALRQSGIDFDTVDASENITERVERSSDVSTVRTNPDPSNIDRLSVTANDNNQRIGDSTMSLGIDDRSELGSLSKESSVSANKNTLLSPSTDEEDLFDVPPDLPEDPQKEDSLFGRAPILSPVDRVFSGNVSDSFKPLRDTHISGSDENECVARKKSVRQDIDPIKPKNDHTVKEIQAQKESVAANEASNTVLEPNEVATDPLRDSSHDPLKDPSQLFAFVTKTPSPEKGKNLLFSEDDSLFSSGPKKPHEDVIPRKQILDLFADDTEGDLFSAPLAKPVKKPPKDAKISLFDDNPDDDDGSLFGTIAKKQSTKLHAQKSTPVASTQKKTSLFDDDDDANLFGDQSEQSQKSNSPRVSETSKTESFANITESRKVTSVKDIFADQSSGEDDIFASKLISRRKPTSKSLFMSDDEDDSGPIFGASSAYVVPIGKTAESRPSMKKSVTRDLKKTAEKIVEDPLSLLQND